MKTTFEFNFDLFQAIKQQGYKQTLKQKEKLSVNKASLCLLVNLYCQQSILKQKGHLHCIEIIA